MANVIGPAMTSMIGAGRMERSGTGRDVWIVRGGWGDGMEFTSEELENARVSPEAFMALVRSKTEQHMARVQSFPPRWWPGSGPEPPPSRRLIPVGPDLMEATIRYTYEPGSVIRYSPDELPRWAMQPEPDRAAMSRARFERDNKPAPKKPAEEVILKPRKYGKDG